MPDTVHDRLYQAYLQAQSLAGSEREALLQELDQDIADEVRALLAIPDESRDDLEGQTIDERFRILELLGEGAFGKVYLAEEIDGVVRKVALKILSFPGKLSSARFQAESQALAMMNHPNIARLFRTGILDSRPYIAMEYIEGPTLREYCDRRQLDIRTRIRLFLDACVAIEHAHQKGVIHRDLKDEHLLVDEHAEDAVKIIDFGLAKALHFRLTEGTIHTRRGEALGTLGFMSPEQASGSRHLDVRTDIYSMGVILYQLLTGRLPVQVNDVQDYATSIRKIQEDLPDRPSQSARKTLRDPSWARKLEGDLDWILLRALEKDPARRYPSISELIRDLRAHLEDRPVLARAPGLLSRSRQFVRRRKVPVLLAATIALFLMLFTVFQLYRRELRFNEQLAEAQTRARNAESIVWSFIDEFFTGLYGEWRTQVVLRERIDSMASNIGDSASAHRAMGRAYFALGLPRESRQWTRSAYKLARDPRIRVRAQLDLASLSFYTGSYSAVIEACEEAIREAEALSEDHVLRAVAKGKLIEVLVQGGNLRDHQAWTRRGMKMAAELGVDLFSMGGDAIDEAALEDRLAGLLDDLDSLDPGSPEEEILDIFDTAFGPVLEVAKEKRLREFDALISDTIASFGVVASMNGDHEIAVLFFYRAFLFAKEHLSSRHLKTYEHLSWLFQSLRDADREKLLIEPSRLDSLQPDMKRARQRLRRLQVTLGDVEEDSAAQDLLEGLLNESD